MPQTEFITVEHNLKNEGVVRVLIRQFLKASSDASVNQFLVNCFHEQEQ